MTFRIDGVSIWTLGESGQRFWHWRIKGIEGRGVYGSIVSNPQGRGMYILEGSEMLTLLRPDGYQRVRCLMAPRDVYVSFEQSPVIAREVLAIVLLCAGWGPRVDERGDVMPFSLLEHAFWGSTDRGH
jgi:hypothetical protein